MKSTLKDTQVSLRLNGAVAEAMKKAAKEEHLSLADYLTKLFDERGRKEELEARVEALEKAVFNTIQAA
ncbi:MAG: hypothetical protein AAFV71_22390 [Cyanobacteria bacterium J06633_8]